MQTYTLMARRRSLTGKQVAKLRHTDLIPAVLYGHAVKNENLEVPASHLAKIYRQAGSSSLVDLVIDEAAPQKVLIHGVQRHPTRQQITHVDFYQVRMTEKLQADIELSFIGESQAVKEQGGILVRSLDKVKVESLPGDLVPAIEVDISALKTFEDRIHVRDIVAPKGIAILDNPEEVVASVTPPRSDAELEALSKQAEVADVSKIATEAEEKKQQAEEQAAAEAAAEAESK